MGASPRPRLEPRRGQAGLLLFHQCCRHRLQCNCLRTAVTPTAIYMVITDRSTAYFCLLERPNGIASSLQKFAMHANQAYAHAFTVAPTTGAGGGGDAAVAGGAGRRRVAGPGHRAPAPAGAQRPLRPPARHVPPPDTCLQRPRPPGELHRLLSANYCVPLISPMACPFHIKRLLAVPAVLATRLRNVSQARRQNPNAAVRWQVRIIISGVGSWRYVDCVAIRAGKLQALEYVRTLYGVPLDRCVAAGDSGNDILMLEGPYC